MLTNRDAVDATLVLRGELAGEVHAVVRGTARCDCCETTTATRRSVRVTACAGRLVRDEWDTCATCGEGR